MANIMEFEAQIKASQAEQVTKRNVNLEDIDVYRKQYHHLLTWSSIGSYEQRFFYGRPPLESAQ
jgi:hypothetical protein